MTNKTDIPVRFDDILSSEQWASCVKDTEKWYEAVKDADLSNPDASTSVIFEILDTPFKDSYFNNGEEYNTIGIDLDDTVNLMRNIALEAYYRFQVMSEAKATQECFKDLMVKSLLRASQFFWVLNNYQELMQNKSVKEAQEFLIRFLYDENCFDLMVALKACYLSEDSEEQNTEEA